MGLGNNSLGKKLFNGKTIRHLHISSYEVGLCIIFNQVYTLFVGVVEIKQAENEGNV